MLRLVSEYTRAALAVAKSHSAIYFRARRAMHVCDYDDVAKLATQAQGNELQISHLAKAFEDIFSSEEGMMQPIILINMTEGNHTLERTLLRGISNACLRLEQHVYEQGGRDIFLYLLADIGRAVHEKHFSFGAVVLERQIRGLSNGYVCTKDADGFLSFYEMLNDEARAMPAWIKSVPQRDVDDVLRMLMAGPNDGRARRLAELNAQHRAHMAVHQGLHYSAA
jgi:hypothetical protein